MNRWIDIFSSSQECEQQFTAGAERHFPAQSACFARTGFSEALQRNLREPQRHNYESLITATYEISIRGKSLVSACGQGSQEPQQGNVGSGGNKVKPSERGRRACPGSTPASHSFMSDRKMKQQIDMWLQPVSERGDELQGEALN